jgi:hypothetical protein
VADECPSEWYQYFVQPDGVIKCTLQTTHAPHWTIGVVAIVFFWLAWRDFLKNRRKEFVMARKNTQNSTSLMVRTGIRMGFHTLLLLVGAYLVAWIGVDLFTEIAPGVTMVDKFGNDANGSTYQQWVQLHGSSYLSSPVVWPLVGAALLVMLLVWSALAGITPLNTLAKGLLIGVGYLSLLAAVIFTLMGLMAYFGFAAPESKQLAYIYGMWILGWMMLAFAGLSLPISSETLAYSVLPSRPTHGLYGE